MPKLKLPRDVGEALEPALAANSDHEALVASNGRLTYADLDTEVEKAAAALAAEGLGRGDVVATSLPNATDVVVTFHAIARLGAVWLGLNRNLAPPEKRYILADAGAKVFLADPEVADQQSRWPEIDDPLTIVVDGHSWADRLASTPSRQYQRIRSDPFDVAAIAYTSGTTGRPKGVIQTHHNILLPGAVVSMTRGFGPELRKGDCAALTILNMQVTSTLLVAQAGGTQVLIDQTDPLTIARWIRSEKVNVWFGVPTLLQGLAKSHDVQPDDLDTITEVWTGGTHLPAPTRDEFTSRFGHRPLETYGLTEVPTMVTMETLEGPVAEGTSGSVLPHLVVEIRGDDGGTLPVGEQGLITIRAQKIGEWANLYRPMLGYLNNPEATAATVVDGTLITGDIGYLDESGHLFVTDRKSALILRGGANIYPAEVERVLLGATGVKGVAVVGFPDERLGHRVAAAIETDSGADLDVAKLTELCSRELAYYKVPERWRFAILPRNAMGKVVRKDIENWFSST